MSDPELASSPVRLLPHRSLRPFSTLEFAGSTLLILLLGIARAPAERAVLLTPAYTVIQPSPTAPDSEAEECPKAGSPSAVFVPDGIRETFEQQILDFLNSGGSPERMAYSIRALAIPFRSQAEDHLEVLFNLIQQDVTGDGIREVILSLGFLGFFQGDYVDERPYGLVLTCRGGSYERIGLFPFVELFQAGDLTGNHVPELIFFKKLSSVDAVISTFEWDGYDFRQLTITPHRDFGYRVGIWTDLELHVPLEGLRLQDVDSDENLELVVARVVFSARDSRAARSGPLRDRREVWGWNGAAIALERWDSDPPEYRFQAVQDGDDLTQFRDLERALASYRRAINDDRLNPFQLFQTPDSVLLHYGAPSPTPNPAERLRLTAYTQFRIILVHLLLGDEDEAESALLSLVESHPESDPGSPYSEMAEAFWEAYASGREIGSGCEAAVDYALRHANEVLIPLGSSNYGYWNREYLPEDICPFEVDRD